MKFRNIIIICICLFATSALAFVAFAQESTSKKTNEKLAKNLSKDFTNEKSDSKNVTKGSFKNNNIEKKRKYQNGKGKKVDLEYKTTQNFENRISKDKKDKYGTYDEFTDKDNTIYYFLQDTDKLCLKMQEYEYNLDGSKRTIEKDLSNNIVKNIADKYIVDELGESSQKYSFQNVEYQEQKGIYLATYIRKIGKYITDDSLTVFVNNESEVYAFSAMNRDRYEAFDISDIDQESLNQALLSIENGEWKLEDILISMDQDTGRLIALLPSA